MENINFRTIDLVGGSSFTIPASTKSLIIQDTTSNAALSANYKYKIEIPDLEKNIAYVHSAGATPPADSVVRSSANTAGVYIFGNSADGQFEVATNIATFTSTTINARVGDKLFIETSPLAQKVFTVLAVATGGVYTLGTVSQTTVAATAASAKVIYNAYPMTLSMEGQVSGTTTLKGSYDYAYLAKVMTEEGGLKVVVPKDLAKNTALNSSAFKKNTKVFLDVKSVNYDAASPADSSITLEANSYLNTTGNLFFSFDAQTGYTLQEQDKLNLISSFNVHITQAALGTGTDALSAIATTFIPSA